MAMQRLNVRTRWLGILSGILIVVVLPSTPAFAPCHVISFDGDPYSVGEGAGKVTITVSNGGGQGTPTVDYDTVNGTAKAGSDYVESSGTVQFVQGDSEATFDIPIANDAADEPNEAFTVRLMNPSNGGCNPAPFIQEDTATVTIQDNDEKAIVQPTPTPTPTPTKASSPKPKPSTASASPSPTLASPSPTTSASPIAAADPGSGGLSGGALAGIVAATVLLGGAAAFWVRRRFLT
jgi:hypothetical protein